MEEISTTLKLNINNLSFKNTIKIIYKMDYLLEREYNLSKKSRI